MGADDEDLDDLFFEHAAESVNRDRVDKIKNLRLQSYAEGLLDRIVEYPELLSKKLHEFCGDLEFDPLGLQADLHRVRSELPDRIKKLQEAAANVLELCKTESDFDPLTLALAQAIPEFIPEEQRTNAASKLVSAIDLIANEARFLDFRGGNASGRPPRDESIQRAVNAVAAYCGAAGMRFSPAYWSENTKSGDREFRMTESAYLTKAVLKLLRVDVPDTSLSALMRAAAKHGAGKNPA